MKIFFIIICSLSLHTLAKDFHIYLDADLSNNVESGESIRNGMQMAIDHYFKNKKENEFTVTIKSLDHRGNTRRSLKNFKLALDDPKMIAVFGGLHSPPLITNKGFINDNQIPTLVTWAAGGPITRTTKKKNWIFRLSVDDSQAGRLISQTAVNEGCQKPHLVLENTPWGKSNENNMRRSLQDLNIKNYEISLFDWAVSKSSASDIANKIKTVKSSCIFFVGNAKDASVIFKSLGESNISIPIYSHWGITSANSIEMANLIKENKLNVKLIQTSFSFVQKNLNQFQKNILESILKRHSFSSPSKIQPMTGWVHGFDLMTILLNTIEQLEHDKEIKILRSDLRNKLENLNKPIKGLVKEYRRPFSGDNSKNAHEALNINDYVMRSYKSDGSLH